MNLWSFIQNIGWRPWAGYFFILGLVLLGTTIAGAWPWALGIAAAAAAILLLGYYLAWTMYKRLMRPLKQITEAAKAIAQGNLNRRLKSNYKDEIRDLAVSINNISARLGATIAEITGEKNRVQAILNSMVDGVMAVDGQGRIIMVNPAVEQLFGVKQAHCIGKSLLEVVRNYDLDQLLQQVLAGEKTTNREIQILTPEPRIFHPHITRLDADNKGGAVILLRDITERRRGEQMRSEFVANVSHELRTPLTSIRGFVETLLDSGTDDPEMAKHFLNIIAQETLRLSKLVDELLYLSKVEERRVVHRWQKVGIDDLIDRVIAICGATAEEKEVAITANLPSRLPPLFGDPDLLAQVMINLMDNAIKFTPSGGKVTVSAAVEGQEIKIDVADTGVGIPFESLSRIFERFYRIDKARSRELGGIGLGLAIVKHIVMGHGGRVDVKSAVGKGTVFSIYLPLDSPSAPNKQIGA